MFFYSILLPYVQELIGIKLNFFIVQSLCTVTLILPFFTYFATPGWSLGLVSANGVFLATYNTTPFTLEN